MFTKRWPLDRHRPNLPYAPGEMVVPLPPGSAPDVRHRLIAQA
jgi:hypothetical protein